MRRRDEIDWAEVLRLLPALGVLGVWGLLMANQGGFDATSWLPAGLALLALLLVCMRLGRRVRPHGRATRLALGALGAFTAWCYLSIAWSAAPGSAWDASNLLLVSFLSTWILALTPWRAPTLQAFVLGFSLLGGLSCLLALIGSAGASNLAERFTDARFAPPLYYPNATAGFCVMAALPALVYAARPGGRLWLRALCQGNAVLLCAFALLPQSRGAVLGVGAALLVLAIVVPFRWRMTLHLGVAVLAMVIMAPHASHLYEVARTTGDVSPVLRGLVTTTLALFAGGAAAGGALAWLGGRVELEGRPRTAARRGGFALVGLCVLAVAGVGVQHRAGIGDTLSDQWQALRHPGGEYRGHQANDAGGRLNNVDPLERYDYFRVSVDGFLADPLGGMGAGGFEHRYTETRRYEKLATYPHNLALKVLGDTGLIGVGLMIAFLAGVLALLRRRDTEPDELALRATALAVLGYFLLHGMFDWLEAYPVLVGPALGFPVAALGLAGREARLAAAPVRRRRRAGAERPAWRRPAGIGALGVLAAATAFSLAAPWRALHLQDEAMAAAHVDRQDAYRDLDRAAAANRADDGPLVSRGVLALSYGDMDVARASFTRALAREDSWLPHFGLGLLDVAQRRPFTAKAQFDWAEQLNPRSATLGPLVLRATVPGGPPAADLLREALTTDLFGGQQPVR